MANLYYLFPYVSISFSNFVLSLKDLSLFNLVVRIGVREKVGVKNVKQVLSSQDFGGYSYLDQVRYLPHPGESL